MWMTSNWSSFEASGARARFAAAFTAMRLLLMTSVVSGLSVEGVSQMVYILPKRLLALVRPAFDLVLRRIRSLKRCVEA